MIVKSNNVLKVTFEHNETLTSPLLWQHDKGQILQFTDISDGTQVEFANKNHERAEPYIVQNSQVKVPDFLLEEISQITAYVKVVDEKSETTVKKITMPVLARPQSDDGVPPENQQTFKQQIQEIMDSTQRIAQSVRDDADNGVFKGDKGDKGEQGEKGDTGQKGEQGIPGTDGKDGVTPVKGIDYFTEKEIEQIKQGIADDFSKKGKWELVAEITATENEPIQQIILTQGLDCDDVFIEALRLTGPTGGNFGVQVQTSKNQSSTGWMGGILFANPIGTSIPRNFYVNIERLQGQSKFDFKAFFRNSTNQYTTTTNRIVGTSNVELEDDTKIKHLNIYFSSTNTINAGTIRIYKRTRR